MHADRANPGKRHVGIRHRKPAKLRIVIVNAIRADPMRTQIAQVDDAQDHLGGGERCDRDRDLYENGAQDAPLAADPRCRRSHGLIPFSARNVFILCATNALPFGVQ